MTDKEISATLWSEHHWLNNLITENLPQLGNQIEQCGLRTGKIQCLEGAPPDSDNLPLQNNLINITV